MGKTWAKKKKTWKWCISIAGSQWWFTGYPYLMPYIDKYWLLVDVN